MPMFSTTTLIQAWILLALLSWGLLYLNGLFQLHHLDEFDDLPTDSPDTWPRLSVVVAACNEADAIEEALETLLAQSYPELEIVAVDDRSDDGTGEILDRLSDEHEALRVVHVDTLPDDWLGKVHALHRGVEASSGEWVLLTDADVHFREGVLRRAVSAARADDADLLTLVPDMKPTDFWHRVAYAGFVVGMLQAVRFHRLDDREAEARVGVGAFNLVKRSTLKATEGLEWLRMEIADDMALGQMISRQGGTIRAAIAHGWLEVEWYDSLPSMARGLEKNTFGAVGGYSYLQTAGITLFLLVAFLGPFYGAVAMEGAFQLASFGVFGLYLVFGGVLARRIELPLSNGFTLAAGHWIMVYILLRSAYYCWKRGGIEWGGETYPIDKLRDYQRIEV